MHGTDTDESAGEESESKTGQPESSVRRQLAFDSEKDDWFIKKQAEIEQIKFESHFLCICVLMSLFICF